MRIGKPVEHLQSAVKSLEKPDPVLKITAIGRQLGYAGYLFNDMLVWVRPISFSSPFFLLVLTSSSFLSFTPPKSVLSPLPLPTTSASAPLVSGSPVSPSRSFRAFTVSST
jgi:hypothetical protein